MSHLIRILVILLLSVTYVESAKILCVFMIPSVSHQAVYQPIWKELSLRGHQVTVLTPSPLNDPSLTNLTEINLHFSYEVFRTLGEQSQIRNKFSSWQLFKHLFNMIYNMTEVQLSHPDVLNFINDHSQRFDVVLLEFWQPSVYAFKARFDCPMIVVSSLGSFTVGHDALGNPTHPALYPDISLPLAKIELNFFDRLLSTIYELFLRLIWKQYILPEHDSLARKYFGDGIPYLGDIEKNISMLFLNTNPIIHPKRPNVPSIIELGNMYVKSTKTLPEDIKEELDNAKNGVVYFSLGSNVRSDRMTEKQRQSIIEALSQLPYQVFWKWEKNHLPNQPDNVKVRKWFPQKELLAHPNVKAFVTQGGLQSMEEAIANEVPLVVLPFFGDQPLNAVKMVSLGIALHVNPYNLDATTLKNAILEVATNQSYKRRISEIDKLITDLPMTGVEKAAWWTEYVIRHKGATHLRSPAIDYPWYKYYQVDIIAFILFCLSFIIYIVSKLLRLTCKLVSKLTKGKKIKTS